MITRKQYLKAIEIVKNYEEWLRLGKIASNELNDKVRILFDDTFLRIEFNDNDIKLVNSFEYEECVKILLTEKQYKNYIEDDTNREFDVSKKKIDKMIKHIHRDDNVWRKKN